jgi:hypothetical protein
MYKTPGERMHCEGGKCDTARFPAAPEKLP